MILVAVVIAEHVNACVLPQHRTTVESASEHGPLAEVHLAVLEMAEGARTVAEERKGKHCRQAHSKCHIVPASFRCEQLVLVKQVRVRRSDDLVCCIVRRVAHLETRNVLAANKVDLRSLAHLFY